MNIEELKKKIKNIVAMAILEADELPFVETAEYIADALIAAEIGDVKETEHRASVMQLALENACEIVFSKEIDDEYWDDVIFNYKKEKGIREVGITPNILYDYLKEQAEKELAEEEK